ncbi:hypothetical protein AB0395_22045 [Streptosporangium sp. NPDC051023]|uniref:hypothetical protein n=1 Tax=Streptosporangium sp. NPDC051023 TaxID=3155410 RepID=UPI00344DA949
MIQIVGQYRAGGHDRWRVIRAGNHLLVFPADEDGIQCVVATKRRARCRNRLDDSWTDLNVVTVTQDGRRVQVDVEESRLSAEELMAQRCATHHGSDAPDHVPVEWAAFNIDHHADLAVPSFSGNVWADTGALVRAFRAGAEAFRAAVVELQAAAGGVQSSPELLSAAVAGAVARDLNAWLTTGTSPQLELEERQRVAAEAQWAELKQQAADMSQR